MMDIRGRQLFVVPVLVCWALCSGTTARPQLNEECLATVLTRTVTVSANGTFTIPNVPIPRGAMRVRVICEAQGHFGFGQGVSRAAGPFVLGVANGETDLGEISFDVESPVPVALEITSPATVLTPLANPDVDLPGEERVPSIAPMHLAYR